MHLRAMMTTRTDNDEDVLKLIGTMDIIRQRLLNVFPDGLVSVDDLYVSSLISALPESWTSVTDPLELQLAVTPSELKKVLRGHAIKLKNHDSSHHTLLSTALSTTASSKKPCTNNNSIQSKPDCDYCKRRGHSSDVCHRKQMDNQRKEIDALKAMMKNLKITKSAKVAHVSDTESDESLHNLSSAKATTASSLNRIKFSRMDVTKQEHRSPSDQVYNADTGCTDSLINSASNLQSHKTITPTSIFMADDSVIKADAFGPMKLPIALPSMPGLVVPGLAENLLSIGQLANHGVTSVFTKDKVKFYESSVNLDGVKLGEGH